MFLPLLTIVLLALLVLVAIATWLVQLSSGKSKSANVSVPAYEAVPALLTPAERSFFGVLCTAVGEDFCIFVKVRLADVVRPRQKLPRSEWQATFNRIVAKHVDFVLCDLASLRTVGVIELDDSTHSRSERALRDAAVDSALGESGIPIMRVAAQASYSPVQLREQVLGLIGAGRINNGQHQSEAA
jgi:hypothetical protein